MNAALMTHSFAIGLASLVARKRKKVLSEWLSGWFVGSCNSKFSPRHLLYAFEVHCLLAAAAIFVILQIEFDLAAIRPRVEPASFRIAAANIYIASVCGNEAVVFIGVEYFFLAVMTIRLTVFRVFALKGCPSFSVLLDYSQCLKDVVVDFDLRIALD